MPARIEDYALIGDCRTAALIGRDASVDWLCWPRFDSGACFAALLGTPAHGRWRIAPLDPHARRTRRYRDDTPILETAFDTGSGVVRVIDFMPLGTRSSTLVRLVVGDRGRVPMRMQFVLRFDYGSIVPWVTRLATGDGIRAVAGPDAVVLRADVALRGEDRTTVADFTVAAGDTVAFTLEYGGQRAAARPDPLRMLAATEQRWTRWARRCKVRGPWQQAVRRSLITLKALTFEPTGGIVAAPTTSLPEQPGGVRNWDYRYCWLRDATLTLLALMNAGYYDEAGAWRAWLERAVAGSPDQAQIMYGLAGERRLTEWEVPWLPGYGDARPVRIGNAAATQLQLDVFGEVMDALHQARKGRIAPDPSAWAVQCALMSHLEQIWQQPDHGMWEVRSERQHFTASKVMAWVAFDRAVKGVERFGLPGPAERWRRVRAQIHDEVCRRGFSAQRGTFVRSYGSDALDASLLLIPGTGFLPASDPRVRATAQAIEHELAIDGLVRRYATRAGGDGLPPGEGVFLPCSFWLADNLFLQQRHAEARALFERLLALRNDVGLLAEEYDPVGRRMLGNFPQAFSHVALVNTAVNLSHASGTLTQRGHEEAAPAD